MDRHKGLLVLLIFVLTLLVWLFSDKGPSGFKYCTKKMRVEMRRKLEFSGTVIQNYLYFDSGLKNKLVIKLDHYRYTGQPITNEFFSVPEGYTLLCDSYLMVKDSTIMFIQGKRYKSMEHAHVYSKMGDSKIHLEYKKGKYLDYPK